MNSVRKFDARPKLNGSWKFIDDYSDKDMIYGYLYYAKVHHGVIKKKKFPLEFDLTEFTIVYAKDIPGKNIVPEPEPDQPFMTTREITHFGQIIMGIAHPNKETLRNFVNQIKVDYDELPALTDIKETLENEKNAFGKEIIIDHRRNFNNSKSWIKTHSVYYTSHQEQAYLEPQGMIAIYDAEKKTMFVKGTMQCPFFVKDAVVQILGNSVREVIVETSEGIGGAFGGKEDFPNIIAGITALLSYKSGKPVKTILDRSDDIQITTKRHPSRVEIETLTDPKTQKIRSLKIDYRLDAGAFQTLSPVVLARGVLHASGSYAIEDSYIQGRLFRSNTPTNGAFRGFGAPQAFFAIDSHIEKIAAELNLNPYDFRKKNIFRIGDELPSSQKIPENHLLDCFEKTIQKSDYQTKYREFIEYNKNNKDKKGIGISLGYHGGGYTGNGEKILNSEIKITIEENAEVKIFVANTEMGQGAHTTLAQIVSETLDHPLERTIVQLPNTSKTPNSGPTVASRTIYIVGHLLRKLSLKIKKELNFENLEKYIKKKSIKFPLEYRMNFVPDPSVFFNEDTFQGIGYKDYSWAACVSEIYFHADSYQIEVKKIWTVLDIGKVINLQIAEGQVQGGLIQAVGYATSEFFYKKGFGRLEGFTDYVLPTSLDIPEMDIEFIHTNSEIAKGLGEIPMDYPAPSIRNAFYQATGIFINEIPLTPEIIFKHIREQKK